MIKVLIDFSNYTDSDLSVQAKHIIENMTGNAAYATPAPAPTDVQTALDAYTAALADARGGGEEQTALKNQAREALETLLSRLGLYVQLNCQNDEAIALSSGFKLAKNHEPVGPLPKPENLRVRPERPGQMSLSVHSVPHATGYLWKYKSVADTTYQETLSTKARIVIEDLVSGQQYSFMVTAIGSNPTQTWSDEVRSFVL